MDFSDLELPIQLKRIRGQRSLRIRVYSHRHQILVTAPYLMSQKAIRSFVLSQMDWIRGHYKPVDLSPGEALRVNVWGTEYQLVFETSAKLGFTMCGDRLLLQGPEKAQVTSLQREKWLNRFYLEQMRHVATPLVLKWQAQMQAPVKKLHFRKMHSRWGSCSPHSGRICLNTELAKYPKEALEYVIVHECAHFFVPDHSAKFKAHLDLHLPQWRSWKRLLDR